MKKSVTQHQTKGDQAKTNINVQKITLNNE